MQEPKIKPQYKDVALFFCGECQGNAERSLVKAGYSERYARGNAYKVIAHKDVQAYIAYINYMAEKNTAKRISTVEDIQCFWSDVMNDVNEGIKDRLKASELLAKAKGVFSNDW